MWREDRREGVTGFLPGLPVGWELFSEPAVDGPLLGLPAPFSATSAITLSFLQLISTSVTFLSQEL